MKREYIKVGGRWHIPNVDGSSVMCNCYENLEWTGKITAVYFTDKQPSPMCKGCKTYLDNGYPREIMRAYNSRREHRGVNS